MNMAELIKKIRTQTGLTQKQFAKELHVVFATINRWENNKSTPNGMARAWLIDFCKKQGIETEIMDAIEEYGKPMS